MLRTNFNHALLPVIAASLAIGFLGCGTRHEAPRAPYVSLTTVEATYGPLVTAGNHPTGNQNGTGERVGFFQESRGNIWGLPLAFESDGTILACVPLGLHNASVTDSIPADSTVVVATNEPTGFRGGTGELEILLRDSQGAIESQKIVGAQITAGPVCWAPDTPGPRQQLYYYRLSSKVASNR
jgi:hypothetical protein